MLKNLHMSHLTGRAKVIENGLLTEKLIWNKTPHTIGQMFFKPYESKKEFIFCARHTVQPVLFLGLAIINPIVLVILPLLMTSISAGFFALAGINKCLGKAESAAWALNVAEFIFSDLCQTIIDLVVLPLAALSMITRGISTGLKAAKICDYDSPNVSSGLTV